MHSTLAIAGIQILSQSGYDPFSRTLTLTANMSQGAAAMACALKTKNQEGGKHEHVLSAFLLDLGVD